MKFLTRSALLAAALIAPVSMASAATILSFTQAVGDSPFAATTNSTNTQTTLTAADIGISIGQILSSSVAAPLPAFLTLKATSTDSVQALGSSYYQDFSGTFEIFSGTGETGTNYLSGSFTGLNLGSGGSAGLTGSGALITFSSDVITALAPTRSISLSFANVHPELGVCGTTLCGFNSSVTGTFSAGTAPVPEPASWAMMVGGFGLLGAALRRKRNVAVSFG